MNRKVLRRVTGLLAGGLMLMAQPGFARDVSIYLGEAASGAGIQLTSWGSGTAKESTTEAFIGSRSIEVVTGSLFSGATISFNQPVDIGDPTAISQYDYLEFMIKFKTTVPLGISQPTPVPTWANVFKPIPGDYVGYFFDDLPRVPRMRNLRVVMVSDTGRSVAHTGIVTTKAVDDEGWVSVALPLAAFGLNQSSGGFNLRQMKISGDYSDTFWIGQIRVIKDDTPIFVSNIEFSMDVVSAYDLVVLKGEAEAGRTSLLYSWDFNADDGIQEDATGQLVEVLYKKAGTYTITLTAKDPDGIKQPVSRTAEIYVE